MFDTLNRVDSDHSGVLAQFYSSVVQLKPIYRSISDCSVELKFKLECVAISTLKLIKVSIYSKSDIW